MAIGKLAASGASARANAGSPELESPDSSAARATTPGRAARRQRRSTGRSYASIVRANVLTVFNFIIAAFGALTLLFGDWRDALFLSVIVANSAIGIAQEVRAKRAIDRLSLLVAPRARVIVDGTQQALPVEQVSAGDLIAIQPGDQLVADGHLLTASELRLDESILSGESEPAARGEGEAVRSGAFVVEGNATYRAEAIGAESFAGRLTGEARSFRHPRSPLERSINRLLYALVAAVLILGTILGYSLYHRHIHIHAAVATATAGVVSLIPEGLVVLVSLTYAVAAIRMARRGILAQQLNAIESLASVDVICIDKTGTLTESALRMTEARPVDGVGEEELRERLGSFAAGSGSRNLTLAAIGEACPAATGAARREIPFASRRRWSAVEVDGTSLYLGAPERISAGPLAALAGQREREGRRVLVLAHTDSPLPAEGAEQPPPGLRPLGIVVLAERIRPGAAATIRYLLEQGVEIKVLSGDSPQTVAAIARDVGIPAAQVRSGEEIPTAPEQLASFAATANIVGRISPEGKRALVQALAAGGRYVAMVGDGVNDVPALKRSRLAIAQGSGAQMARAVADLVLVDGDFAAIPLLVAEGRRALRNLTRVSKLYVAKSAFAAFLILTIGTSSDAYPLLPRQLTLAASVTVGIPTFFLALAPSSGPWRPERFVMGVMRFAVPAGTLVGVGIVAGYLFARHDLGLSVADSRTVAVTVLIACGLYLVLALEAEGSWRRSTLVAAMCAALAGLYVAALLIPATRKFFALTAPGPEMIATALVASALAIVGLMLSGYTARARPGASPANASDQR